MIYKILCNLFLLFAIFFSLSATEPLTAQPKCVQFDIIGGNAPKGDCIWVPIIVYRFDTILSVQFALAYDPLVIMPIDKWATSKLIGLDVNNNINFDNTRKIVRFLWANPNGNCAGLQDGDTLIMIKFKLIGEPGTCTNINFFNKSPIQNEVLDCNADEYCFEEINPNDNPICIGQPVNLCVISYSCGTFTNTGTITIKPYGGTPPYFVNKITAPTQLDTLQKSGDCVIYNNLFPGNYQFRVIDATGKDTILDLVIGLASPIAIFQNGIRNPTCWNTSDGSINIRITGGSGSYVIGWRPTNVFGVTNLTKLPVGTYMVNVRDSVGCFVQDSFTLFADTLFGQVNIVKDASCKDDGIVLARATGGDPCPVTGYCYYWSQNTNDNVCDTISINDSLSGNQFVIIEDCRGCRDTQFFDVKFSGNLLDSIVIDTIKCFGDSGRINSFIRSSGTLNIPCLFQLTNQFNQSIFGGQNGVANYISPKIPRGTYILKITDNAGCERIDTIVLTEPNRLEILENNIDTTESCQPGMDAFIDTRGFGGTAPYSFRWNTNFMGSRISNLSQGNYILTITDANGCTTSKSYQVIQPNGPRIDSFRVIKPTCPGDATGRVEVIFTLGSRPIQTFRWNVPGTTAILNNVVTGTYYVTLTDQNGCEVSDSIILDVSGNSIKINSSNTRDPLCFGRNDGFIIVGVSGGQGALIYKWDNGVQTAVNTNLTAGTYCLNVDDTGGCPAIDTCFTLVDPLKTSIQLAAITAPTCATVGTCDAQTIILATGKDSTYSITWPNGEQVFRNSDTTYTLCSGNQYVIVTNGFCADTFFFNVPAAIPISIDTPGLSIVPPRCYLSNDGQINIKAKGGTGPYQYCWVNPMINSPSLSNLGDGMYFINIKDSFNCVHQDSIRLRQPDSVRVDVILGATLDITCSGKNDGRITTAWTGGNRGKGSFSWSPNINQDSVATNLPFGNYILTVTDIKGCTGTASYTVLEPPPLQFVTTPIDTPRCPDDQILFSVLQAQGGSGPLYRFTIDNGAPNNLTETVPLFSGTYSLRVYDKNNCFVDTIINISNPTNLLALDFGKDIDTIQLGDSIFLDGKLNSNVLIDTINWSPSGSVSTPGSTSSYVRPGRNTSYVLTVIDENGCEVSDNITIIVRNARKLYVPNTFSPNGDNINDFFTITTGPGVDAIKSVQVFDRWGNKVYNDENPDISSGSINTWNGRFGNNGDFMNPGVFVYIIEALFRDGTTVVYRGDLTLLR